MVVNADDLLTGRLADFIAADLQASGRLVEEDGTFKYPDRLVISFVTNATWRKTPERIIVSYSIHILTADDQLLRDASGECPEENLPECMASIASLVTNKNGSDIRLP